MVGVAAMVVMMLGVVAVQAAPGVEKVEPREKVMYALVPTSMALYGCWEPCKCPVHFIGDMYGEFMMQQTSATPGVIEYAVTGVYWEVWDFRTGSVLYTVTGSGTYTITSHFPHLATQRLELDLDWDGRTDHFDSGDVPLGPDETISLTVANHDFYCLNDAFLITAVPVLPGPATTADAPAETGVEAEAAGDDAAGLEADAGSEGQASTSEEPAGAEKR
jgi:hypothetical protein